MTIRQFLPFHAYNSPPLLDVRPTVDLRPTTLHILAGKTTLPSVSVPIAAAASPTATLTALPVLDPRASPFLRYGLVH